jgi:hypothetical protein
MISNASSSLPPGQIMRGKVLIKRLIFCTLYVGSQPKIGTTARRTASRFAFAVGRVCRFGKPASIQESTELARKRGHSLDQRLTAPTGPCCVRLRVVLPPERHPQIVCFIGNATTIQVELQTQGTTSRSRTKRNRMIQSPTCRNQRVDKEALQETIQPSLIIKKTLFLMSPC